MQFIKHNIKHRFDGNSNVDAPQICEVQKMLRLIKCSSPGMDGIHSFFLSGIVPMK